MTQILLNDWDTSLVIGKKYKAVDVCFNVHHFEAAFTGYEFNHNGEVKMAMFGETGIDMGFLTGMDWQLHELN